MPIAVNLIDLVCLPNSEPLWPEEFQAFVRAIHRDHQERTRYGVCADWLEEKVEEDALAAAFRFVATRSDVFVNKRRTEQTWYLFGLGTVLRDEMSRIRDHWPTVPHLLADLAVALEAARRILAEQLEQLK